MGYAEKNIAEMIAAETWIAIGRPDVSIKRSEVDLNRYFVFVDLPDDFHIRFAISAELVSHPIDIDTAKTRIISTGIAAKVDLDLEAQRIVDHSRAEFQSSIKPFVDECKYRVDQWFDYRELKRVAQSLAPMEVEALRNLKDSGVYDPQWQGLPMDRNTWDRLIEYDPKIAALNNLCEHGLARLHDALGFVSVWFIGRGADALSILDQNK